MIEHLAIALRRMAAEERADPWRQDRWAHWYADGDRRRPWMYYDRTAEREARAQIYEDWAQALMFPGGPVHVDWVRYGCSRESLAG